MDDSVMAEIPILHTSNIIVSDPTKFSFIGSFPEAMLLNVPANNLIVNEYLKKAASSVHPMPEDLRKAIEEGVKLKRGGKRKDKANSFESIQGPKKKVKKAARKTRSPSPVQEPSESRTHSDVRENDPVHDEV